MKILVIIPSYPKFSGVDFHRLWIPHTLIGKMGIEVSVINEIDSQSDEFIKAFDFIIANRFISKTNDTTNLIQRLKELNVKYILDLDDDYQLPVWHLLYGAAREKGHKKQIVESLQGAYAVTTTHDLLAKTIMAELGQPNVYVCPNQILPEGQFQFKPVSLDKITFGWGGSITHFEDVLMVHDSLLNLYKNDNRFKMVYGGYDGTDHTSSAIAGILSCKGTAPKEQFEIFPAKDVLEYGNFYDFIDIALIPLRNNRFNNMKSNLKLLEAGFKKKAVIVSDVFPYSPMLKHGINCLVVKNKNDWFKHMNYLINNPKAISRLANQLYKDVQIYHADEVARLRYSVYVALFEKLQNQLK